jgi:hypothetical protein
MSNSGAKSLIICKRHDWTALWRYTESTAADVSAWNLQIWNFIAWKFELNWNQNLWEGQRFGLVISVP